MADFKQAVLKTLEHEGGYVNDPADPGGATKYGITQKDMPGRNIADITTDDAVAYYSENYWKPLYSQITSQVVAEKLFDMGVLFGVKEAVVLLQLTLQGDDESLKTDGIFGAQTLALINSVDETSLLSTYKTNLVTHTFNIATKNVDLRKFLKGWANRINS